MVAFRTNTQIARSIVAAESRAQQQSKLNASLAVRAAEAASVTDYQPVDDDLSAMAGLSPSNDDIMQRKAGAWVNRSPAQVKTDLSLAKGDVGLGNVDNTSDANKPVSTAQQTALNGKASLVAAPASAGASGTAGQIAYDSSFFYVCVATNTWLRAAIATW